ncbi:MAG: alpha/beta hydrolase [Acidimicrobiaceae bacterium]|nr:alpha/beta hydrolase [Acidimicrobiaceae bacterium]MYC41824.1 alpha/beta hydrolase [Acidimicrobiaceae bacterium]
MPDNHVIESLHVDTAGLRFHYLAAGDHDAPPVVLLHGFPQTSHMWRHQIPVLAEHYRVLAPDTRGYGGTDKPRVRVSRDLLARDIVDFIDALGVDHCCLVGHDWGGIIAFKAALEYPDRFRRLGLVDTLCSVWIPWGIHGYWFKCEPEAEQFWERYASEFITSIFGGAEAGYGPPPHSPWKRPASDATAQDPAEAMSGWDPTKYWTAEDVEHFRSAFDQPDALFHAVSYYRDALPFHLPDADGSLVYRTPAQIAEMWNHTDQIFAHPDFGKFPVFAPEDLGRTYPHPALFLYSAFMVPQAFVDGPPNDDQIPSGNPHADSFIGHFPDYRARHASCGHFICEEDPQQTNEVLLAFLAGHI